MSCVLNRHTRQVLDFIVAHGKLSEFQAREFFAQVWSLEITG